MKLTLLSILSTFNEELFCTKNSNRNCTLYEKRLKTLVQKAANGEKDTCSQFYEQLFRKHYYLTQKNTNTNCTLERKDAQNTVCAEKLIMLK